MSKKVEYLGKFFTTKQPLKNVECWNFTTGEKFTIPRGTRVHVDNTHDATHTTICLVDENGKAVPMRCTHRDGVEQDGYRFIIPNVALGKAIGVDLPKTCYDLVGQMMAFEDGSLSETQARKLLEHLKENNMFGSLQGSYGRAARAMGII